MKEEREGLLKDIAKLKAALQQLAARHQGKLQHLRRVKEFHSAMVQSLLVDKTHWQPRPVQRRTSLLLSPMLPCSYAQDHTNIPFCCKHRHMN